jgi:hypothetical protein
MFHQPQTLSFISFEPLDVFSKASTTRTTFPR